MTVTRAHNWVIFDEGEGRRYQMADPDTEEMAEAAGLLASYPALRESLAKAPATLRIFRDRLRS